MNAKLSKISFSILAAILLALGLALAPLQTAKAATCTVISNADSGDGTLRALLADVTCDTITFAGDTTIRLASQLDITRNVSIDGGTYQVVLSGDANGNDLADEGDVRVFSVASGVTASLKALTITRGYTTGNGGGVYNDGTLAVTDSTFSTNSASFGGA